MNIQTLKAKQVIAYRRVTSMKKDIPAYEWEEHPSKLGFKDFVPVGQKLAKGSKIRINHESSYCSGESSSLIIRRLRNGVIGARCYRCGKTGFYTKDRDADLPVKIDGRWFKDITYEGVTNEKVELPKDMDLAWKNWPIEAQSFLKHARIGEIVSFVRNIGYSPSLRKVVLPLYSYANDEHQTIRGSKLIGYQLRRVFKHDTSPKYVTRKDNKDYFAHSHKDGDVCVVVEDYLSYIRCSKFVSTVCLFGTSMSHAVVKALSVYPKVVIFLDNDNNIVKRQQQAMQRELELWVDDVIIISSDKQPKEYKDSELKEAISIPF